MSGGKAGRLLVTVFIGTMAFNMQDVLLADMQFRCEQAAEDRRIREEERRKEKECRCRQEEEKKREEDAAEEHRREKDRIAALQAEERRREEEERREERRHQDQQSDERMMRMIAMALGACDANCAARNNNPDLAFGLGADGKHQAFLREPVPLGVDVNDPDEVVPLVSNKENISKRPRRVLGVPPGRK